MASKHALIVDDSADNREICMWLLDDEGITYDCAEDAQSGLDILETKKFDFVLMDISLPGMDGKEATKIIRANDKLKNLPVIAVTAHAVMDELDAIWASGVTDIINKPIDFDELTASIHKHIKH
ncbi:MAG: response regulator [Spongiibacteraceae bacterium]|nr:response regulator [Spongiibacteraceae bacterium]